MDFLFNLAESWVITFIQKKANVLVVYLKVKLQRNEIELSRNELRKINGGKTILPNFLYADYIRMRENNFV